MTAPKSEVRECNCPASLSGYDDVEHRAYGCPSCDCHEIEILTVRPLVDTFCPHGFLIESNKKWPHELKDRTELIRKSSYDQEVQALKEDIEKLVKIIFQNANIQQAIDNNKKIKEIATKYGIEV